MARFSAGAESADFVMLRYVPDLEFAAAPKQPGAVVILSWQDLAADLILTTRARGKGESMAGDATDAAAVGLSSLLLPAGKRLPIQAHLRSATGAKPLPLAVVTIEHDGRGFQASLKRVELAVGQTDLGL